MNEQFAQLVSDPSVYRDALFVDTDEGPRPLAAVVDPWQQQDFAALDAGWRRAAGQQNEGGCSRAWLERPRGHSKTADVAAMIAWALLTPHRRLSGVAAAADADQARLLRDAIAKLCQLNPWLASLLDLQRNAVKNLQTDSTLTILTADAPSSYGLTPDFIIADEITHWRSRDLWDSLLSAAAKRAHSLLLVIGNAGFQDSWQWATREAVRNDPGWHFHALDGPQASWISEKTLAEQKRLLPAIAYARLWLNRWSAGSGDALEASDIAASVVPDLQPATRARPGHVYVGGLDLGLKRDSSAFVILEKSVGETRIVRKRDKTPLPFALEAARELGLFRPRRRVREIVKRIKGDGRLRLAAVRVWKPEGGKVDLDRIERTIIAAHKRFGLARVAIDPWQAEHLGQRLERAGVPVEMTPFTSTALQGMATAMIEAFGDRQIELFEHPQLLADLRALRIEERAHGFRLTSPRGPNGHGDCATALALALLAAKDYTEPLGDQIARGGDSLIY